MPLQSELQQTPSAQCPFTHSLLATQLCPSTFLQLLAPSHTFAPTQVIAAF